MAVDPQLQAQLEQLQRENDLLDQRIAAKQKAQAEAQPSPASTFMDYAKASLSGFVEPFKELGHTVAEDYRKNSKPTVPTSIGDFAAQSVEDLARVPRMVGSALNLMNAPVLAVARPAVKALNTVATPYDNHGRPLTGEAAQKAGEDMILTALGGAAKASGLARTAESAEALVGTLAKRFKEDGGLPPLVESEVPQAHTPRALPAPEESPAYVPPPPPEKPAAGAAEAPAATTLPAKRAKPAGDSKSGPAGGPEGAPSGEPQGDPWANVDWGKMRSKERAAAAAEHLDFLKKYVKPEHVQEFVAALDRPVVEGQLGDAERVASMNPKYVDWDKLDANPEDILQWANIRSAIFKDLYGKAGDAPKTWDQIDRASRLLGKDVSTLIKTHADITGEGGIAARVGALQQVTLEAADAFHAQLKATRAKIEAGDLSGLNDFAAATQRIVLLESMAEGSVSEIARALNYMKRLKAPKAAFNDLQNTLDTFSDAMNGGRPVDQEGLKKAMDNLDQAFRKRGASGVRGEIAKMRELGFGDYVGYSIVGGLLSAPKTWIRNMVGTPIMSVFQTAERYLGAGVGAVRTAAGIGSKERMTLGEANAYVASSIEALHDAFGNGWKAFKTGAPITPGGSWAGEVLQRPTPFAFSKERAAEWAQNPFSLKTFGDVLGTAYFETVRTFGFRPSVAADEFYKTITRRQQLSGLAYREAHYRASLADPKDYDKVFAATLDAVKQQPTAQAFKEAKQWFIDQGKDPDGVYPQGTQAEELATLLRSVDIEKMAADHATLLAFQDSGPLVKQIDKTLRMMPLIKWFYVPFFKTPMALLKAGIIDRNPLTAGLLGDNRKAFARLIETAKSDEAAIERGGAEADLAIARLMIGGAFMSFGFMLWANGHLVGRRGEPGDPTKQDGVLEYSVKAPTGEWVQYSSLDPILGSQLGLIADLAQTLRDHPLEDGQAMALVGGVAAAIRNNIMNKAALSGLKDFFETWYGTHSGNDKSGGKAVAEGLAASGIGIIPLSSLLRNTAQELDPVRRDARSFLDNVKATIPTWSETLPARRDAFGRPLVRRPGERGVAQALNTSKLSNDPLDLEQSRLAQVMPDFTLRPPNRSFNNQPVTPAEYSRVLEIQGQLYRDRKTGMNMEEAATDLIASDQYATWSDEMRGHELKDLVTKYREEANAEIRDPRSEFYMADMVKRTATDQLKVEVPQKGLHGGKLRHRARLLGLSRDDTAALEAIFQ